MKILLISHSPNDPNGGASRVYHLLAQGLIQRGHEVRLLHLEDMRVPKIKIFHQIATKLRLPHYVEKAGLRLPDLYTFDILMVSSGQAYRLFRKLRSRGGARPILVNHLHGLAIYDELAARSVAHLGFWPLGKFYNYISGSLPTRWDIHGIKYADYTIVQNYRDESFISSRFGNAKHYLIPPCLHPDLLQASTDLDLNAKRPNRLLWFGSWERRKGAYLVPDVLKSVSLVVSDVELVIGGTGLAEENIIGHFHPSVRHRVRVLQRVSVAEQIGFFKSSAIFLFPSWSEGFGLAVMEAMAFGCCAVSTNTGGFIGDYARDNVDAMIVYPSIRHISDAIVKLLTHPELQKQMSRRGRELARAFTPDRMVEDYVQLYNNSLATPNT